jgi:hypothetical protein
VVPSSAVLTPKNARGRPVTKLCLALEMFRRSDEGRIRDAKAFLGHFFPQDDTVSTDRLFVHIPKEVRADLLSNWGIRGKKSALRDDDERVRTTVTDALAAGDIDATVIEDGVTAEILIDWAPLEDWWTFWRGALLPLGSVRKALALSRELALFDDRWFFSHLSLPSQNLDGTDVVCAALSKEQIGAWVQAIHVSGDASPTGLVTAVGWDTILGKTAHEALLGALDALAREIGLTAKDGKSESEGKPTAVADNDLPPFLAELAPAKAASVEGDRAKPAAVDAAKPATAPKPPPPSLPPPPRQAAPAVKPAAPSKPDVAKPVSEAKAAKPAPDKQAASKQAPPVPGGAKPPAPAPPPLPTRSQPPSPMPALPSIIVEPDPPFAGTAATAAPLHLPAIMVEPDPFASPPMSRPDPRALFGAPAASPAAPSPGKPVALAPMRPPAATLAGVGPAVGGIAPPLFETKTAEVAIPTFELPQADPPWAPPRAEPGDMGWDIVYGVKRSMATNNVHPKYNFDDDDEPTSEIALPTDPRPGGA